MTRVFVKPTVASEFGEYGLADGAAFEQLFRAPHLGISSAIVSHAKGTSTFFRNLHHRARLGLVHSRGLLAQHMLVCAKRLDGLRRVKEDRSSNVDRLNRGIGESFVEGCPSAYVIRRCLCRVSRDQAIQPASGLRLNRGNDATDRDIADSNYDPVQHGRAKGKACRKLKAGLSRPSESISNTNYFLGAIASLAALATRNFTTVLALIWIGSPVCGLRPMRALRCAFTNRPRPGTTNTPFFLVSFTATSASCSRNAATVLLGSSVFSAR